MLQRFHKKMENGKASKPYPSQPDGNSLKAFVYDASRGIRNVNILQIRERIRNNRIFGAFANASTKDVRIHMSSIVSVPASTLLVTTRLIHE
jgi:hypothetical protein